MGSFCVIALVYRNLREAGLKQFIKPFLLWNQELWPRAWLLLNDSSLPGFHFQLLYPPHSHTHTPLWPAHCLPVSAIGAAERAEPHSQRAEVHHHSQRRVHTAGLHPRQGVQSSAETKRALGCRGAAGNGEHLRHGMEYVVFLFLWCFCFHTRVISISFCRSLQGTWNWTSLRSVSCCSALSQTTHWMYPTTRTRNRE